MKPQIQFVHTDNSDQLQELVQERLNRLKRKYDWIINAKVILKEEYNGPGREKSCAIELSVPGENVFQEAQQDTFERAIAESFDNLQRLLQKHKAKMYRH